MPELAWEWAKQITWGEGRTVSLDWGMELWKWDVSLYESADGIRTAIMRAGKLPVDDDSILFEATGSLVLDIVDAAGGVEQAHQRLHRAMDVVHETLARWSAEVDWLREGMGITDPSVEAVWYTVEELLVWARVLDERLRRRSSDRRRYPGDQGLIPALANGPRREAVVNARARLLQGGVHEARYLSGLNLHMQSTQAGSKHGRIHSGQVFLRFPDYVSGPIGHRWQLTYNEGRDVMSFADGLMAAVKRFMDDMILAFEDHLPERFRAPTA
jgi:hypothetical protein